MVLQSSALSCVHFAEQHGTAKQSETATPHESELRSFGLFHYKWTRLFRRDTDADGWVVACVQFIPYAICVFTKSRKTTKTTAGHARAQTGGVRVYQLMRTHIHRRYNVYSILFIYQVPRAWRHTHTNTCIAGNELTTHIVHIRWDSVHMREYYYQMHVYVRDFVPWSKTISSWYEFSCEMV